MASPEAPIQQAICPTLIGREEQLGILEAGLAAARHGQGQTFIVIGEAGIGKTRLAAEVRRLAAKSGMTCLWGSCSQAELALPYLPIIEAVGGYLAHEDLEEIARRLGPLAGGFGRLFPQMKMQTEPEGVEAYERKLMLFESVVVSITLSAAKHGSLLVVEDLHWADSATRELIDYVIRRLGGSRVMVLATYRSDEIHRRHPLLPLIEEWRRRAETTIVDLHALDADDVADMVRAIFQVSTMHNEFRDLVMSRSAGNPFVIEEMLKDAIDRGDIFRTDTGWDRKPITELRLPRRIRETVTARLEQLTALQVNLLRAAAILGRPFDVDLLAKFVHRAAYDVHAALNDCVQHQLLALDRDASDRYDYRHALTREAVYDDLIPPIRRQLHARAAKILAVQRDCDPVEICRHLFGAEDWDAAIPVALTAAEQATAASAHEEAALLYERLLPHITDLSRRTEILILLSGQLRDSSQYGRAARYLEAEIPVLEQAGEYARAAKLRLELVAAYTNLDRDRRNLCMIEAERARDFLETRAPSGDLAEAYCKISGLHLVEFRNQAGIEAARRAIEIATEVGDHVRLIEGIQLLGSNLCTAGAVQEGFASCDRAVNEALDGHLYPLACQAIRNDIEACVWEFRWSDAMARLELWRKRIPGWLHPRGFHFCEGLVSWRLGELEKAAASSREATEGYRERGAVKLAVEAELLESMALADLGRFEESRAALGRAPALAAEHTVSQAWARMRLGVDSSDLTAALAEARMVIESVECPLRPRRLLSDIVVETLIAAGDIGRASATVTATASLEPADPYQMRMEGRLALAAGDLEFAIARLTSAVDFWHNVGGRLDESRSRRLLGQAKGRLGDQAGAVFELKHAFSLAHQCGAAPEESRASEELIQLGVATEPTPADVKTALEDLHNPQTLGESALLRTMSLRGPITGAELRDLLVARIRGLAQGSRGREDEAGRLLLDYYVNRVGSQEVVAERLHVSRRTFYRRLDQGLFVLANLLSGDRARPSTSK